MISMSDSQSGTNYNQLDADTTGKKECKRWNIYFLVLCFCLGAETFVTSCLLYGFASDIHATRESLTHGGYPVDCLYQLADPEIQGAADSEGTASCNLMNNAIQNGVHKRLLLDIRNSLWRTLGEHNITQSFKPAIHLGAKQGLKQYHYLQKTDWLQWDSRSGQSSQEGLMRLGTDGELEVPQNGIYFVYSHVHFESTPGLHLQFMQYLFKRRAMSPQSALLSKAASSPCLSSESGVELYSSQQGALFHLERGDWLSLYVLNTGAVRFCPESTYFGAFMIN
ncbi:tumor necrosis factor (ligand) superfamily, member 10 like 4 [Electrophorus electricus]|uniref:Tumor necrosis factor (ligand) superfamily, member 10 like 4 n=1 Tax=Electrophorus electricus TaxID=8005 RepID=A0A4W4DUH0_ELEEL|nr:tumor necrosis factor (ligand) superfamily, member 10 like 4 [Electrophorus electricus]